MSQSSKNPFPVTTTVLKPLNSCMYCGIKGEGLDLTDEHVMARGLNGVLLFPKSSCRICQKMIGREIEEPIQRNRWLADPRLVLGLRSYKPNRQSLDIKMTFVGSNGQKFQKKVPKQEAVAAICLPILIAPRLLAEVGALESRNGIEVRGTCDVLVHHKELGAAFDSQAQMRNLCRRYNAQGVDISVQVRPPDLCRFLCKTAFAYHVAMRGSFPREESPALAIMRNERSDYSNWIGSEDCQPNINSSDMHELTIEDAADANGVPCTIVKVQMFTIFGADMRYCVVTRAAGWEANII